MLTEDHILRMINQAVAVLVKVLGLKKSGQTGDALQSIDQALEGLLGLDAHLLKQMDDESLLKMLTVQDELDLVRLALVADLFVEEGEILQSLDRVGQAYDAHLRALRFLIELALSRMPELTPDLGARVRSTQKHLTLSSLPVETQLALLDYDEGLLEQGNDWMQNLGEDPAQVQSEVNQLKTLLKPYLD